MRHADYAFQSATNATSHDFTKSQRVAIVNINSNFTNSFQLFLRTATDSQHPSISDSTGPAVSSGVVSADEA